jgi:hypothetical protein
MTEKVLGPGAKGDPDNPHLLINPNDALKDELKEEAERLGVDSSGTKGEIKGRLEDTEPAPTGQPSSDPPGTGVATGSPATSRVPRVQR